MTESLFSIFPDTATGSLRCLENKPILVKGKIFQPNSKGAAPVLKKKALGDVGNTLQSKRLVNQPTSKLPAALKSQVPNTLQTTSKQCKGPTVDSQTSLKDEDEESANTWDTCSQCCAGEEDNYLDIRPMSDRLTTDDLRFMIKGMFRGDDQEPIEPISPLFDIFRDEIEFIPQLVPLPTSYYNIDNSSV